ncbi:MazG-like protein [Neobacillus niacini]|uniref:MazG-like protein n=1 Tax=Neobacillus niacini TaxID=86668 RepID=UPI0030019807
MSIKERKKMKHMKISEAVERSIQLRKVYHRLERQYHEKEWTVEEDALAFLTDAGLVGRLTMSQQGRWPTSGETASELEHKIGECMWWLIILAELMNIDSGEALEKFLTKTEKKLGD